MIAAHYTAQGYPVDKVLGTTLRWSIFKEQVRELLADILSRYSLSLPELVTVRSDNGSQFVAKMVREFLAEMKLIQEFTRPATPQQNGHIEAWHSIIERSICQRMELQDLAHGQMILKEFVEFYNNERIHSGIGYKSPKQYLKEKGIDLYQANDETKLQCELS
jgi:putative transposase